MTHYMPLPPAPTKRASLLSKLSDQGVAILARGDVSNEGRFIVTVEDWGAGYAWRMQKDGGADLAQFPDASGDARLYRALGIGCGQSRWACARKRRHCLFLAR